MRRPFIAAAVIVLALAAGGCGSQSSAPSAGSSSAAPGAPSATATGPQSKSQAAVQVLRDHVQQAGTGTFSEVTRTVAEKQLSSIRGRYALGDQQLAARLRLAQASGKTDTARVDVVGSHTYLQVDQWKRQVRGCWLSTSSDQLAQAYGLDIASTDAVPLPVQLLDNFRGDSFSGKGLIQGRLDLALAARLLSGSIKQQVLSAKPTGVTPAFLTYTADSAQLTVPGYALSTALSQSLHVDESKLTSVAAVRLEAGLTVTAASRPVTAPGRTKQMTAKDLAANRCG